MRSKSRSIPITRLLMTGAVLVLVVLSITLSSKIVSIFYKQLGAIALSKGMVELQTNPEKGQWRLHQAEAYYQQAIHWNPADTDAQVKLGELSLASGKTQPALDYLVEANRLRPGDRLASLWLGIVYSRAGLPRQAADLLGEAGAFTQLVSLGNQYASMNDYDTAAAITRVAIKTRPDDARSYRRLGNIEEQLGNTREAIDAYSSYVAMEDVDLVQKYLAEAHIADIQERWSDAIASYNKALDLASKAQKRGTSAPAGQSKTENLFDYADLHFHLGLDYGELGRQADSLRELQETVRLGGTSKLYYRALADAYFAKGDFQSSVTWYRKVLEIDPADRQAAKRMKALEAAR